MNTNPNIRESRRNPSIRQQAQPAPASPALHNPELARDFQSMQNPEALLEMLTVPGFLRRVPYRFHLNEVARYGSEVGRMAESMQLAYMTGVDASLGVIRVFPMPLMKRVYDVLQIQFGWPKIIDADLPALEELQRAKDLIKLNERTARRLREVLQEIDDVKEMAAFTAAAELLEKRTEALRQKTTEAAVVAAS